MAVGWAKEDSHQEEMEAFIGLAIQKIQLNKNSVSKKFCIDCDNVIPEKRRTLVPGVQRCIKCQSFYENFGV